MDYGSFFEKSPFQSTSKTMRSRSYNRGERKEISTEKNQQIEFLKNYFLYGEIQGKGKNSA
jgi:hypothetical protein